MTVTNFVLLPVSLYNNGISYERVCGRARGYQKGDIVAFYGSTFSKTIENDCTSGLSITYGSDPRKHVWTFTVGISENSSTHQRDNCPCTNTQVMLLLLL